MFLYENHIIHDVHFRNHYEKGVAQGFILCLRINYYRGIPLSMIHDVVARVDDEVFRTDAMTFVVDGRRYSFEEMNERSDVNWFFGEDLRIEIAKPGGLAPGKKDVEVTLTPRNSYFGPTGQFPGTCRRTLTFA